MRNLVSVSAAALVASVALAAPAMAQNAPFSGPRIEVLGGYDNLQDGGDGTSEGRDGFAYGGGVGYDVRRGGLVLGVEGELTDSTTKARQYNAIAAGDRFTVDAGRDFYVGGRIGAVISPQAMVYAKGGYTNARIKSTYDTGTTTLEDRANLDGFRVGAGIEYNLTPSSYVKGEYRYSHYGEIENSSIDLDRHQLMAGVGFRF
jgi:outer membrane immunogenic protein